MRPVWAEGVNDKMKYFYCHFSIQDYNSEYELDDQLFAGFISAVASFASSLANKNINFINMDQDDIFFVTLEEVIVVAIVNEGAERQIVHAMLEFIGEQFLAKYSEKLHITS